MRTILSAGIAAVTLVTFAPSAQAGPEALSYCWQTGDFWFCDGPVQKTVLGFRNDIDGARDQSGCPNPSSSRPFAEGTLFYCGFDLKDGPSGKATWNRDIRGWYNIN